METHHYPVFKKKQ